MLQEMINALIPVMITALTGIISYIGIALKKKLSAKLDTEEKRKLIQTVVKYVEQVYTDIHGKEKLDMALQSAEELFEEKGIKISHLELEMMIEEAVNNIKNS